MKKTVLFGPFIGEFGWEFLHWQGWVNKMCLGEFKNYHKVVCAFAGRQVFYKNADQFVPIPDWFCALNVSGHGYITDGWRDGLPGKQANMHYHADTGKWSWEEERLLTPDVELAAEKMLAELLNSFPGDTRTFVPWKFNECSEDNLAFGVAVNPDVALKSASFNTLRIPYDKQHFEHVRASETARDFLQRVHPGEKNLICVYPRSRSIRRSDKNWSRENYQKLIKEIQKKWPHLTPVCCGEAGGAYFTDGVPAGCIDLINVGEEIRLDLQIAALERSVCAVGAVSGALAVAAAAGCPTVIFCTPTDVGGWKAANIMQSPMILHPDINPEVEQVMNLTDSMIQATEHRNINDTTVKNPYNTLQLTDRKDFPAEFAAAYDLIRKTILSLVSSDKHESCEVAFCDIDICYLLYNSIIKNKHINVVESGSFMGMSTLICAQALKNNHQNGHSKGKIYTISLNNFYRVEKPMTVACLAAQKLQLSNYVEFLEGSSVPLAGMESADPKIHNDRTEYLKELYRERREALLFRLIPALGTVDLAYLDGLHYECVQMAELAAVIDHLSPNGEIIMDDIFFDFENPQWITSAFLGSSVLNPSVYFNKSGEYLRAVSFRKNHNYTGRLKKLSTWWSPLSVNEITENFSLRDRGQNVFMPGSMNFDIKELL